MSRPVLGIPSQELHPRAGEAGRAAAPPEDPRLTQGVLGQPCDRQLSYFNPLSLSFPICDVDNHREFEDYIKPWIQTTWHRKRYSRIARFFNF